MVGDHVFDLSCLPCCTGETVVSPCCADPIPVELTGTITDKTGFATNLPDTITLTYDTVGQNWIWTSDALMCSGSFVDLSIKCNSGQFLLSSGAGMVGPILQAPDASPAPDCSPFDMTWTVTGFFQTISCGADGTYKIRITA